MDHSHIEHIISGLLRGLPSRHIEDCRQEAWLAVIAAEKVHDQHPEWGSIRNTVYRVARWAILNERKRRVGLLNKGDWIAAASVHPDAHMDAETLLDRLGADDRLIVELRFWAGLTNAEIGCKCGISGEAVRQRIERILTLMRNA